MTLAPEGMREVSKEYFYSTIIGNKDAVIGKPQGNYPYTTNFKLRNGRILGISVDRYGINDEPFIVTEYFCLETDAC